MFKKRDKNSRLFITDYVRFANKEYKPFLCFLRTVKNYELRFLLSLRLFQKYGGGIPLLMLNHYRRKYGIEIVCKNIGKGLRLIHPWGITVNSNSIIGDNVTIYKGVTIGGIDEGKKKGCPNIGDNVTLYTNAVVCGNIRIGNNCIIASNSFVNFDVPNNSIVIGNPGIVHNRK